MLIGSYWCLISLSPFFLSIVYLPDGADIVKTFDKYARYLGFATGLIPCVICALMLKIQGLFFLLL